MEHFSLCNTKVKALAGNHINSNFVNSLYYIEIPCEPFSGLAKHSVIIVTLNKDIITQTKDTEAIMYPFRITCTLKF